MPELATTIISFALIPMGLDEMDRQDSAAEVTDTATQSITEVKEAATNQGPDTRTL